MNPTEPKRQWHPFAFDEPHPRWYHYFLRRLPASLLLSFITLFVVVPLLVYAIVAVYRWLGG
jgi:hypothetical protein